jgi:hypothetical protein
LPQKKESLVFFGRDDEMRGTEKKVLYVRNTESTLFEEAYFILKKDQEPPPHRDMVEEAARIIRREYLPKEENAKKRGTLDRLWLFLLGGLFSALIFVLCRLFEM